MSIDLGGATDILGLLPQIAGAQRAGFEAGERAGQMKARAELWTSILVMVAAAGGEVRTSRRLLANVDLASTVVRYEDHATDEIVFKLRTPQESEDAR